MVHLASYQDVYNLYGIFRFNFRINISAESITQVANNKSWRFRSLSVSLSFAAVYLSNQHWLLGYKSPGVFALSLSNSSCSSLFILMLFVVTNEYSWLADAKCPAVSCALCSSKLQHISPAILLVLLLLVLLSYSQHLLLYCSYCPFVTNTWLFIVAVVIVFIVSFLLSCPSFFLLLLFVLIYFCFTV